MSPAPIHTPVDSDVAAEIAAFTRGEQELMRRWRRDLHQHPEPGWLEYRTSALIAAALTELGFTVSCGEAAVASAARRGVPASAQIAAAEERARTAGADARLLQAMRGGHTGVVAQLDTGRAGPHTAVRVDVDALEITESQASDHYPAAAGFRSRIEGVMHACGHDGHVAVGIAAARYLVSHVEQMCGRFTLLFQPAEEGGRGGAAMTAAGWLDEVDYLLACHLGLDGGQVGQIVAGATDFLASSKFDVEFTGRAAHAGQAPHAGRNALLAAATAVLNLHAIARHGHGATRLNVGSLHAGTARNVVPAAASMALETRGATSELDTYMATSVERIVQAAADMHQASVTSTLVGQALSAASDEALAAEVEHACREAHHVRSVRRSGPLGASEDASFMLSRVQDHGGLAAYLIVGSPTGGGHHTPTFDVDEAALPVGLEALAGTLARLNGRRGKSPVPPVAARGGRRP